MDVRFCRFRVTVRVSVGARTRLGVRMPILELISCRFTSLFMARPISCFITRMLYSI